MRSLLALLSVCGLFCCFACGARPVQAAADSVQLTMKGDALDVTIGGQPFAVYHFGKSLPKPYFWPIRDASGQIVTRPLVKPTDKPRPDHPHHRGLWFSIDEVNGIKFWAEKGKIENVSVEPIVAEGNPAKFKVVNHWLGKDGQPIMTETTTISIDANRMIAYDAELTATKEPVTFRDTKEGMFGFRMVNTMREMRGGKAVSDAGVHGTAANWGKTANWIDYDGMVEGKLVGAAIFDNPHNFRPSRYHVRDYGLFSISPFGEGAYTNGKNKPAPYELKPGANLRLRYAIYFHDGDTQAADVAGMYRKYVASAGE